MVVRIRLKLMGFLSVETFTLLLGWVQKKVWKVLDFSCKIIDRERRKKRTENYELESKTLVQNGEGLRIGLFVLLTLLWPEYRITRKQRLQDRSLS